MGALLVITLTRTRPQTPNRSSWRREPSVASTMTQPLLRLRVNHGLCRSFSSVSAEAVLHLYLSLWQIILVVLDYCMCRFIERCNSWSLLTSLASFCSETEDLHDHLSQFLSELSFSVTILCTRVAATALGRTSISALCAEILYKPMKRTPRTRLRKISCSLFIRADSTVLSLRPHIITMDVFIPTPQSCFLQTKNSCSLTRRNYAHTHAALWCMPNLWPQRPPANIDM